MTYILITLDHPLRGTKEKPPEKPKRLEYHSEEWYQYYSASCNFAFPDDSWRMDVKAYEKDLTAWEVSRLEFEKPDEVIDYLRDGRDECRHQSWKPKPGIYEVPIEFEKVRQTRRERQGKKWHDNPDHDGIEGYVYRTVLRLKQEPKTMNDEPTELELLQKQMEAMKKDIIKFKGWENEPAIPPINMVVEMRILIKKVIASSLSGEQTALTESERIKHGLPGTVVSNGIELDIKYFITRKA